MLIKSVILPAFFPESNYNLQEFLGALNLVKKYKFSLIEFYFDDYRNERLKGILNESNMQKIFLGAIVAKKQGLNLSSLDESLRKKSIEVYKKCIDNAYFYQTRTILINSGRRPDSNNKLAIAYDQLNKSIIELLNYTTKNAEDYLLNLTLEPGDSNIDFCEVIGDTELAIKLARELRSKYANFFLTLDTSHLRQLDESPLLSIRKAKDICSHIHLANCIIKNKDAELYGDKHPEFSVPDSEFSINHIKTIYNEIEQIYDKRDLIVGIEIINHNQEYYSFFNKNMEKLDWFF